MKIQLVIEMCNQLSLDPKTDQKATERLLQAQAPDPKANLKKLTNTGYRF